MHARHASGRAGGAAAPQPGLQGADVSALEQVSEAVEAGSGLPAVARAAGRALGASLIVLDSASRVLAVACASSEDERAVMAGEGATQTAELRVADRPVGEMRFRARGAPPAPSLLRMVGAIVALEVERARAPERASEAAVAGFLADLLHRRLTDRDNIAARAAELGCDLGDGAAVIVARARPRSPAGGDWRARVLAVAERGAQAVERTSLAALIELDPLRAGDGSERRAEPDVAIVVPAAGADTVRRAADSVLRELEGSLPGSVVVARSRPTSDPADLHRGGVEALLAANVAEARGLSTLSFEETGAYRLLLPAMSEDPAELQGFYDETVAPLVAYDEQYQTELVRTLETFLDTDASVAKTAERLYTHRHTIRYRLERGRELTGLDVSSTEGRERLSLGLKAMRVLGIAPPGGPAHERGAGGGRVPKEEKDR